MTAPDKILYTAEATVVGGRAHGHAESSDGHLVVDLTMPKELGGPGGEGTNPEQLFAAGYAACFESALMLVARRQKKDADQAKITAQVGIGPVPGGAFGLAVTLRVHIPGLEQGEARELVEAAHKVCPYSVATRGNVPVELVVE